MTTEGYDFFTKHITHDTPLSEVRNAYDSLADSFEEESRKHGCTVPSSFVDVLTKFLEEQKIDRNVKIIDLGAGTGRVAAALKMHGYQNIDALDFSKEMLNVARQKGLYKQLFCETVGEGNLSLPNESYGLLISVGTFSLGHVKSNGLEEAANLVKTGGILAFTVRGDVFNVESCGYKDKIEELVQRKVWTIVSHSMIDYYESTSFDGAQSGHIFICKKM